MCDLTVDRQTQLDRLKRRRGELDNVWSHTTDPVERGEILRLMDDITPRIDTLQTIIDNQVAASVIIRYPTDAEKAKAQQAMDDLSKVIQLSQAVNQIILTMTTILEFIDKVNSAS